MRTIKRYSNRKLYDTQEKRYITLEQISALVREGEDIKVVDNQSGEDLTTQTLSQVLHDQEKKKDSTTPKWAFFELIQKSSNSAYDTVKKSVVTWFENSFVPEDVIEKNVERMVKGGQITRDEALKLKDEFKSRAGAFKQRIDDLVEARVNAVLSTLNIPSKSDINSLNERVSALSAKVETLIEKHAQLMQARAEEKKGKGEASSEDSAAS